MKAIIISCFDTYEGRVRQVSRMLEQKGYETIFIGSDFCHIKKQKRIEKQKNQILLHVKPYYKNISLQRIFSHYDFSRKAIKVVEKLSPEILYILVPPNLLMNRAISYKKSNLKVKLIFDVIDLWPESFPIKYGKKVMNFFLRKRNSMLKEADFIFLQCQYYKKNIKTLKKNTQVLYLEATDYGKIDYIYSTDEIHICYLGSINHLIDIDYILRFLERINGIKTVVLHIIGTGERKQALLEGLKRNNLSYFDYGELYSVDKKAQIFSKCQFGLNIYKEEVCIGMTMKSIDYLSAGLPIITKEIKDINEMVKKYQIGFCITKDNEEEMINQISHISRKQWGEMHRSVSEVFQEYFSKDKSEEKFKKCLSTIDR